MPGRIVCTVWIDQREIPRSYLSCALQEMATMLISRAGTQSLAHVLSTEVYMCVACVRESVHFACVCGHLCIFNYIILRLVSVTRMEIKSALGEKMKNKNTPK